MSEPCLCKSKAGCVIDVARQPQLLRHFDGNSFYSNYLRTLNLPTHKAIHLLYYPTTLYLEISSRLCFWNCSRSGRLYTTMPPRKVTPKEATSIGEKQTIQARHGVATFVPKGHVIKIINTYGSQVVDTWAFALGNAPEDGDIHKNEEEVKGEAAKGVAKEEEVVKEKTTEGNKDGAEKEAASSSSKNVEDVTGEGEKEGQKVTEKTRNVVEEAGEEGTDSATNVSEKVDEKLPSNAKKGWSSYLPSVRRANSKAPSTSSPKAASSKEAEGEEAMAKSWSSYLPSIRGGGAGKETGDNTNSQSKGWSSYIPSGVGFSSYMPPKGALSGFASTHARDPTKSYAEQLFDFSKTPVGAAGLSGIFIPSLCVLRVKITDFCGSCDWLWICWIVICRIQGLRYYCWEYVCTWDGISEYDAYASIESSHLASCE